MCGLVGAFTTERSGGLFPTELAIFKQLLLISTVRGLDGTGILFAGDTETKWDKPAASWIKVAGHPLDLFQDKTYNEEIDYIENSRYIAGHVRAATKGTINENNAHPFEHGDIIGMHNGTLDNIECFDDFKKYTVDSEALIASLATNPDSPRETLESMVGAGAVVWYNQKHHTFNLWRNYQRPLFITKVGPTYFYASERQMLSWILNRNNTQFVGDVLEIPPEIHFKWTAGDNKPHCEKIQREFTKYKKTPVYTGGGGHYRGSTFRHGWEDYDGDDGYGDYRRPPFDQAGDAGAASGGTTGKEKDEATGKKSGQTGSTGKDSGKVIPITADGGKRPILTTSDYFGLRINHGVLIELTNTEWLGEGETVLSITGVLSGLLDKTPLNPAHHFVRIRGVVKGKTPEEFEKILNSEFLMATCRSIVLNAADVQDVTVWVNEVEVWDYDEEVSKSKKAASGKKGDCNDAC